ncbi:HD domain-containing protein (plasmid) [Paroceanicella profunda]|uniref:5'-deoxynucleotidase n=1 Tax=Paroceanicella profunda TaxID=2579971 RepID=A0A5B8FJH1_9RHOB|nr:HD domain-containing protein [Paroceanicella profunda]QDL94427.1 HD domain-containing protein [Paroceanicella profunda]
MTTRLGDIITFLQRAERLKDTLRSGHTAAGRPESTAEHSWRLCLLALLLAEDMPGVDRLRLLELCIVHDLGEAVSGDIPATEQRPGLNKAAQERADLEHLAAPLPADLRERLLALQDEYDAAATPEAVLAKGLDKIETVLQHATGANPPDFDYDFNLAYGQARTAAHPLLAALRALADRETEAAKARALTRGG